MIVRQDNAAPLIITKYREANENDGYLYYVELPDNIVPANTPVLLRCASKNKAAYFDIIEPGTLNVQPVKVVNYLIGSLTGTVAPASTETENRFLWKDNKFNPIKSASSRFNNVDAGSVYMQLPQLKYPDASYIVYTIDPTGGTPLAKPGDVDSNGVINVSDVTALINKILGTADYVTSLCDVDANGTINVSDVTALINMILASAE
ncbi:MAG: dockerin type I repeat-containing protein [Muribaculaceae bacterium]|nr:dockerin type I repeat-containing protein [Muribaculaceae bacterium]